MSKLNSEQFKSVIAECIKDNETLTRIFDLSSAVSTEEDDETSMSLDENPPAPSPTRGYPHIFSDYKKLVSINSFSKHISS